MKITKEKIRELRKKLPQDVRDIYSSEDTTITLEKIGEKHKLHVDDLGELVSETGYVLVGATHPNEYIKNLAERMEIDKKKASEIAHDVNEQVFRPIRESLKKIHGLEKERAEAPRDVYTPQKQEPYKVPLPKREAPIEKEEKEGVAEVQEEKPKMPEPFVITPQKQPTLDPMGDDEELSEEDRAFKRERDALFPPTPKKEPESTPETLPTKTEEPQKQSPWGDAGAQQAKERLFAETTKKEEEKSDTPQPVMLKKKIVTENPQKEGAPNTPSPDMTPDTEKQAPSSEGAGKEAVPEKKYSVDPYREPIE